jgi:hypothetical protein
MKVRGFVAAAAVAACAVVASSAATAAASVPVSGSLGVKWLPSIESSRPRQGPGLLMRFGFRTFAHEHRGKDLLPGSVERESALNRPRVKQFV